MRQLALTTRSNIHAGISSQRCNDCPESVQRKTAAFTWLYTQALLAFRENDSDADKLTEEAWQANAHVPGVLSGKQPLVASTDGYITMGGEDEAAYYVEEYGKAWQATPGAIEWLVETTKKMEPRARRNR